jgi:hypothetical protein
MRFRDLLLAASVAASTFVAADARAVPSYARQMNVACNVCHAPRFPELNAFGRQFKSSGYTLSVQPQIQGQDQNRQTTLSIDRLPPFSLMFKTAYTQTSASQPGVQNDDLQFPQQLSLFVAGKIAPKFGSFVQMTYSQEDDKFGMDNVELRFADSKTIGGKPVSYGVTLNNNPTVEDLWTSTPAWGFPWAGPDVAPAPMASTLIDGELSQDVAGIGAYAFFDSKFYVATTLYRSAHLGTGAPTIGSENTIDSVAPYWRIAWQHNFGSKYLELGGYGIRASLIPEGISGATDDYRDIAADGQYEMPLGSGRLTVHGTLIHERQDLDASFTAGDSTNASNDLDTYRADVSYDRNAWKFSLGYFSTTGDTDSRLYAPEPVDGSVSGSPDSRGWIGQAAFSAAQNIQLMLQYTAYGRFNGGGADYDAFGRGASDNDTLFLQAWLAW